MAKWTARVPWLLGLLAVSLGAELLTNGGFESTSNWDCWGIQCTLTDNKHSGQHALEVTGSGYIRLLNDDNQGQTVQLEVNLKFEDNTDDYATVAEHTGARVSDGWIHLTGKFSAPDKAIKSARIYYQGPAPAVNFVVDETSVQSTSPSGASPNVDDAINRLRKSDMHFPVTVTTAAGVDKRQVQIHIVQKKKAFPFGMAVGVPYYNNPGMTKYRDFIHQHFNWGVPGNALKWYAIEGTQGARNYKPALDFIDGLHRHGMKVRGHCLLWAVESTVQSWVKALSVDDLRKAIWHHVNDTLAMTAGCSRGCRGSLEHWDVNNELLHGQWYENRLHDPNFTINLFRDVHKAAPNVKLFLNDYNVVANSYSTDAYLEQAKHFKAANVGLYGLGAQCHFGNEAEPDTNAIWQHLDKLAEAGLPIWATELDVYARDENRRADFYEKAMKALYSHHAVEGILLWGCWDREHWRGEPASLLKGDNLDLTAAGRRVIDLLDRQWMTDVTRVLADAGDQFTVRGFHGDYEVHVLYQGRELPSLMKAVTLGKTPLDVNLNVHL
ncbi:hypothetical protein C0Q70_14311 [Pomacea canaliculata]|uniref:GH10 domain-containing protein n=1 Tax=Pomacea canaliculata TaxID=400727 RepID=A0A2T7NZR0_POMCA|nr:hypothetical protein C0Q70_14311 [Pomacea canaliculata]